MLKENRPGLCTLSTNLHFDRIMPDLGSLGLSNLLEAKLEQQWFPTRSLLSDSLMCASEYESDQKRLKKKRQHPVHCTHSIVIHVLHFIAFLKTPSQTCQVKLLFWKKKHFSYFNLYCHQQFYSRMSSFVNLKAIIILYFWISWQPPHPSRVDWRCGTVIRHCQARVGSFNRIKMIHYQAYIGRMKYPMFIHRRRWWMAPLMVSCVNQSGWLIRSADSEPQGDGYSNP